MKTIHALTAVVTSTLLVATPASASDLANGGFESPSIGGLSYLNFSTAPAGFGWTVASGEVDIFGGPSWQPATGAQGLDLNGWIPGAIYQDVTFSMAGTCTVSFDMSANPGLGQAIKTLRVSLNPVGTPMHSLGEYSLSTAGRTETDLQWVAITTPGVAVDTTQTYRLQFTSLSLDGGSAGPLLDTVSLVVIPEPSGASLLIGGIALLFGLRRPPTR
jgi:hypothetical protein